MLLKYFYQCIIDSVGCCDIYKRRLTKAFDLLGHKNINFIIQNKADVNFPVVSAASILAKVTRDKICLKLKKRRNLNDRKFGS